MTRFSIFGYYGQGNAGDEAILSALVDGIRKELPTSSICVYSARPEETRNNYHVDAYRFFGINLKSVIKGILRKTRIDYIKSVVSFFRSDIIIIGGGGLFFDTPETNRWIFGYINLIHRAKRFGKKVALVGISIGPLYHKASEEEIQKAFALVDLISVRDNTSKDTLIHCGVPSERIHVIPDLVFTLSSASDEQIAKILAQESFPLKDSRNIALTPCCYNTKQSGWLEQYIAFCERAVTELDSNLWLIPMQRNDNHDDLTAIEAIYASLSENAKARAYILNGIYSAKEIQGVISKADFILAERLHGSIMAINTNTPVLSIAYMPKVVGVLELANQQDKILSMPNFLDGKFLSYAQLTSIENLNDFIASFKKQKFNQKESHHNFKLLQELTKTR
jgi:polysaccharide pyruvyl transferase CsaB